ncbi:MAG: response regulator [Candidatus Nanopelagicales bacterium]|jgi:DNA-binding NarL/FixJ family response regulator|nr:response regulator [Candidatus Nanopelagicales bacterium]
MITILERPVPTMVSAGAAVALDGTSGPAGSLGRPGLAPAPQPVPVAARSARLVLVDDDGGVRLALQELLEDAGYAVVGEAANGAEGLEVIARCQPDVVLLDLRMPGMGGVEVARALRDRAPDVRVIMLSAYADLGLQRMLGDLGVSAYLIKGCPYRRIVAAIDAALGETREAS